MAPSAPEAEAAEIGGSAAWPAVSIVMPAVNEERHLADSVGCILEQDYPGSLEVLLAIGPSKDRTLEIAESIAARDQRVRVVANPSGLTPTGLNAAIAASTGEVIVRVDGHALVPRDYVRSGVLVMQRTGADNVGGIMAAEGVTAFEIAVARAMTSRFGVGGAAFHVGGDEGPALTVYLGCFQRSALDRVGGYDETMVRAQDWEMNLRIRQSGGTVWFTPTMRVAYRPRPNLRALARQYLDYGRWRREVARRHPGTLSLRYLAAPMALCGIVAGVLLAIAGAVAGLPWLALVGAAAPIGYALLVLIASAISARGLPLASAKSLPLVFPTMHLSWGWGFLIGAVR